MVTTRSRNHHPWGLSPTARQGQVQPRASASPSLPAAGLSTGPLEPRHRPGSPPALQHSVPQLGRPVPGWVLGHPSTLLKVYRKWGVFCIFVGKRPLTFTRLSKESMIQKKVKNYPAREMGQEGTGHIQGQLDWLMGFLP